MSDIIYAALVRHIVIMFQTAGLCCGTFMIGRLYMIKPKALHYFKEDFTRFAYFYITFSVFYLVNYGIYYSDNFVHVVHSGYTTIYILMGFLFDLTLVFSFYFWIRFVDRQMETIMHTLIIVASAIYIGIWFIHYIAALFGIESLIGSIDPIVLMIADVIYTFIMIVAIIVVLVKYISPLKFDVNRKNFIICNVALGVYLLFSMIVDLFIQYCTMQKLPAYYGDIYRVDPLIIIFIIVSIMLSKYLTIKTKDADIREHDEIMGHVNMLTQDDYMIRYTKYNLTSREKEILELILKGYSNPQIAENLFISVSTVKRHVNNILKKTGAQSRYELMVLEH